MRYLALALLTCLGCPTHPSPIGTAPSAAAASAPSTAPSSVPLAAASSAPTAVPSSAPSATAAASGPKWLEAASRAPASLAEDARREYARKDFYRHDDELDPVFDRVASQPPTAAGLRTAAKILEESAGVGGDKNWTGSGMSAATALLHAAGLALLADLVTRTCAATPNDAAIGRAVESIPIPAVWSSVHDLAAAGSDRDALRAAGAACGLKRRGD